jgi:hypothetical protein
MLVGMSAKGYYIWFGKKITGPAAVSPLFRNGFGSRLLEVLIGHDLRGDPTLTDDASGVRCRITATL